MVKVISAYDLPDDLSNPNGPTWREKNMELKHNIPVGTLVEVKYDRWYQDGACAKIQARLWIFKQFRDCDGTPLYILSSIPIDKYKEICVQFQRDPESIWAKKMVVDIYEIGFTEKQLTPVKITEDLKKGKGALEWDK